MILLTNQQINQPTKKMDMVENITSLAEINIGSAATNGDTRHVLYCDRHIEGIGHEVKFLVTDMSHGNVKIT